jgi:hypothetical protein
MTTPVMAILALGVWHGVNPSMGWLFATAIGLQERRGAAVLRSLLPLAAGHALAIAAVVLLALSLGIVVPMTVLQWIVAGMLVGFGILRLVRHRHPRYGGMLVTKSQLTFWSLLMATAHGAGLMVVPFVLRAAPTPGFQGDAGPHAAHAAMMLPVLPPGAATAMAATLIHTAGYLAISALLALVVYYKLGVRVLRRIWINLDLVWGAALIVTGIGTVLI